MKKIFSAIYFLIMASFILSLSGCGGGGSSGKFRAYDGDSSVAESTYDIKRVAVISSPALEQNSYYRIYSDAQLYGMDNAQYYVANVGNETKQTTLNLGFSYEPDPNASLVIVNDKTKSVVFAYDPSGITNKWKTGGNVRFTNGRLLRYRSLIIDEGSDLTVSVDAAITSESFDVDVDDIIHLKFTDNNVKYPNSDYDPDYELEYDEEYDDDDNLISRTPSNQEDYDYYTSEFIDIVSYDYVWHADPNHKEEYYTIGLDDSTEHTWDELDKDYDSYGYIAHDIRYTDSSLNFIDTQTATKDEDREYVVYYSDEVASAVAEEKGTGFEGPYIFATLPQVQGSTLAEVKALMTHSAQEAYDCPVFHIDEDGVYSLSGTWNGQIRVESDVLAVLILNGLTVNCPVGPAIVIDGREESFYLDDVDVAEMMLNVDDDGDIVEPDRTSADLALELINDLLDYSENVVLISDDTENSITGANVYRILKPEPKSSATKVNGTDISDQKKLVKMDGAVYSFTSFAIAGGEKGNGNLTIKSTSLEGLGSEMHMVIEGGNINVEAPDDGINVNEDDVSVFTMLGGNLTIKSENGDGIDSNGYVVIDGGTLNITAGNDRINSMGEAGIDAECEYYISNSATYTWNSTGDGPTPPDTPESPDVPPMESPDVPGPVTSPDIPPTESPDTPPDLPPTESPDVPGPEPITSPDVPGPTPVSPDTPAPVTSPDVPVTSPDVPPETSPDTPAITSPDVPGPVTSPDIPSMESPDTPPDLPPTESPDVTEPITSPDVPGPTPVSPDTPAPVTSPDIPPETSPDVPDTPAPVVSPDTPPEEEPDTPSITSPDPTPTEPSTGTDTYGGSTGTALTTTFNFNNDTAYAKLQNSLMSVAGYYAEISDLLSNNDAANQPRTTVDKTEVPADETVKLVFPIYRVSYSRIYVFALDIQELLRFFAIGAPIHIHSTAKTAFGTSFYSSATSSPNAIIVDNNGNEITTVPANANNGINVAAYMTADTNYSMVLTTSTPTEEDNSGSSENSGGNTTSPWTDPDLTADETSTGESTYAPYDADITHGSITTTRGTTTINIGSGNSTSFIVDDEDSDKRQNVPATGYVLPLEHKVNTFSAITVGTSN